MIFLPSRPRPPPPPPHPTPPHYALSKKSPGFENADSQQTVWKQNESKCWKQKARGEMKPCSSRISAGDQDLPDGCLSQAPSFCYHFNGTQQSGHSEPSNLQHFTTIRLPCDKRRLESLVSPAQSLTGRLMFLTHAVSRTCHAHTHHEKTTTYACDPTGWVSNTLLSPYGTCPLVCKVYFNAGGFSIKLLHELLGL